MKGSKLPIYNHLLPHKIFGSSRKDKGNQVFDMIKTRFFYFIILEMANFY